MYDANEWQSAFDNAQILSWDRTDITEQAPVLSLAVLEAREKFEEKLGEEDDEAVQAAIDAAGRQFDTWDADRFSDVVSSYLRREDGGTYSPKPWEELAIHSGISGNTYFFARIGEATR